MFATDTQHITNMQSITTTITPVLIHKSQTARSQVVFYVLSVENEYTKHTFNSTVPFEN